MKKVENINMGLKEFTIDPRPKLKILTDALERIAAQEKPTRGNEPAAWKIAKRALELYSKADLAAAIEAFDDAIENRSGHDPYVEAAKVFYNVTAVKKEQRTNMKTILFAHIYGKKTPVIE